MTDQLSVNEGANVNGQGHLDWFLQLFTQGICIVAQVVGLWACVWQVSMSNLG